MTKIISLPSGLNFEQVYNFCEYLQTIEADDEYVFDYGPLNNVEPFGMLLAASQIRTFMRERSHAKFFGRNFNNNSYAAHMGFYKSVLLDYGKAPGEAPGSNTYLPITKVDMNDFYEESRNRAEHVVDTIERKANAIAKVLSRSSLDLEKTLTYSIREIMRNVLEHSGADSLWFAGQYWPSKNRVEVSILDEGIGIYNSLKKNPKLTMTNSADALYLCLEPGISGKNVRIERIRDSVYGNSGYGLYMTSRICEEGGDFLIGSSNKMIGITSKWNRSFDCCHPGTVIRMRLNTSRLKDIEKRRSEYLREGEERSKVHNKSSILSASQSSRLLLNNYDE